MIFNPFRSIGLLPDTIGNIVVSAGVVIDPMMIDGNEPPEDTLVNDMHNGQATAHMVFSVLHQYLNGFKLFFRDNGGVLVGIEILVSVLPVFRCLCSYRSAVKVFQVRTLPQYRSLVRI